MAFLLAWLNSFINAIFMVDYLSLVVLVVCCVLSDVTVFSGTADGFYIKSRKGPSRRVGEVEQAGPWGPAQQRTYSVTSLAFSFTFLAASSVASMASFAASLMASPVSSAASLASSAQPSRVSPASSMA